MTINVPQDHLIQLLQDHGYHQHLSITASEDRQHTQVSFTATEVSVDPKCLASGRGPATIRVVYTVEMS